MLTQITEAFRFNHPHNHPNNLKWKTPKPNLQSSSVLNSLRVCFVSTRPVTSKGKHFKATIKLTVTSEPPSLGHKWHEAPRVSHFQKHLIALHVLCLYHQPHPDILPDTIISGWPGNLHMVWRAWLSQEEQPAAPMDKIAPKSRIKHPEAEPLPSLFHKPVLRSVQGFKTQFKYMDKSIKVLCHSQKLQGSQIKSKTHIYSWERQRGLGSFILWSFALWILIFFFNWLFIFNGVLMKHP